MKRVLFLLLPFLLLNPTWAALSANTVFEVNPTNGSDTNGGGFVAGASGTDWSTTNPAHYALTNGQTQGTTVILTASAANDMIGNIAYIQGGTGAVVAGWYQITTVSVGASITVDRSTGLTAGTGTTINIGGALQTIPVVAAAGVVAGNKIFVKAEATITRTATLTLPSGGTSTSQVQLIGYTTTRGDAGKVTLQASTNAGISVLTMGNGWWIQNFVFDCNSLATCTGITAGIANGRFQNLVVKNFSTAGINETVAGTWQDVEVTGGTAGTAYIASGVSSRMNIHDNVSVGVSLTGPGEIDHSLITNNTGASSDGIVFTARGATARYNTIYGNGRHGLFHNSTNNDAFVMQGNLVANNGGYGFSSNAAIPARPDTDGNAYYANTSGARNTANVNDTTNINGVANYTNVLDVLVTVGTPFTNAAGGDFTLNNIANQGALVRGTAIPGAFPGISQVGYSDFGALQHQDAGGSTAGTKNVIYGSTIYSSVIQ